MGSGVVGDGRVGERARSETLHLDLDIKGGVLVNVVTKSWINNDAGDHVGGGRNISHDCVVSLLAKAYELFNVNLPMPLQEPPFT